MNRWILVLMAASAISSGCEERRQQQIQTTQEDAEVIRRANAAVNAAVRALPDCEVARPLLVEANQRIDEARRRIRIAANRPLLEVMKAEADRVAQACS